MFINKLELAVDTGRATWQSTLPCDNSYIIGKGLAKHPVGSKDIDWLLVETTKTSGNGAFTDVTNVVRINTRKGVPPPAEDCKLSSRFFSSYDNSNLNSFCFSSIGGTKYKDQETFDSEYTSDYWFYH